MAVTMLTMLMDEALHQAGGESDNVNMEGLKAIYQMLWDNPQKRQAGEVP